MELKIRDAEPHEIKTMAKFEEKVFVTDAFSEADFEGLKPFWLLLNKNFIGWMVLEKTQGIHSQKGLHVASLGIIPEFQGMGFSEMLLNFALCYSRREKSHYVSLYTRESNVRMIRASQRVGFELKKIVPSYYQNPDEDGILMEIILPAGHLLHATINKKRPLVPGFIGVQFGPDADQRYARYILCQFAGIDNTINLPPDRYLVIWVKPGTEDQLIRDLKNCSSVAEARQLHEPVRNLKY